MKRCSNSGDVCFWALKESALRKLTQLFCAELAFHSLHVCAIRQVRETSSIFGSKHNPDFCALLVFDSVQVHTLQHTAVMLAVKALQQLEHSPSSSA